MVCLKSCDACQRGEHEKCTGGNSAPSGVFGGSICDCSTCRQAKVPLKRVGVLTEADAIALEVEKNFNLAQPE